MGGVRFEYRIEPMDQMQGGGRAHPHISPDITFGRESEEEPRRGWPSEEP